MVKDASTKLIRAMQVLLVVLLIVAAGLAYVAIPTVVTSTSHATYGIDVPTLVSDRFKTHIAQDRFKTHFTPQDRFKTH